MDYSVEELKGMSPLARFPNELDLLVWCDWLDEVMPSTWENHIRELAPLKSPAMVKFQTWCWHQEGGGEHPRGVLKTDKKYALKSNLWRLLVADQAVKWPWTLKQLPCCKGWKVPKEAWEALAFCQLTGG